MTLKPCTCISKRSAIKLATIGHVCPDCGGARPAPIFSDEEKEGGTAQQKGDILTREDLSAALLELDRVEREMKTMAGRVSAIKANLKSKLTSQVG